MQGIYGLFGYAKLRFEKIHSPLGPWFQSWFGLKHFDGQQAVKLSGEGFVNCDRSTISSVAGTLSRWCLQIFHVEQSPLLGFSNALKPPARLLYSWRSNRPQQTKRTKQTTFWIRLDL